MWKSGYRGSMKRFLSFLGLIVLVFVINNCKESAPEQKYDVKEYIVNSSDYTKIITYMQTYDDDEPTEAVLTQIEQWIVLNTNAQASVSRDVTKDEIIDVALQYTTLSRDQINTLFQKADTIGKSFALILLQEGYYDIIVIDKL